MESILQGWLTKSPPEKKQLKLFGSKWRKRYFVLYAPPTVDGIPVAYSALLDYYSDKKLHHKRGTINLADCEEVLSSLDSDVHKHVFGLRTMHKSQVRTYYLSAETEPEMSKWVNKLCQVLGLTENDDVTAGSHSQFPHRTQQNVRMAQTVKASGCARQPFARPLTHHSTSAPPPPQRAVPSMPNAPFTRFNISEPNLLDVTSPAETNRRLAWNSDATSRMASPPPPPPPPGGGGGLSRMRNAESFPELDCLSLRTAPPVEGRELPPIPPEKTGGPAAEARWTQDVDYDLPKQKYYGRSKSEDRMNEESSSGNSLRQVKSKGENGVGRFAGPEAPSSSSQGLTKHQLDKRKDASQSDAFCAITQSLDSERQQFSRQLQKKCNGRSSHGQQTSAPPPPPLPPSDFTKDSNQTEDYDVPKSKSSDPDSGDGDYNIPKSTTTTTTTAYGFAAEDYDIPRSKDPRGFGPFGLGMHDVAKRQDLPQEDRLKCLWERAFGGNQLLQNDQMHRSMAPQAVHPSYQSEAFSSVPSSSPSAPPGKPPRPLSRPPSAVADGLEQSGFKSSSCLNSVQENQNNDRIGSGNDVDSYDELRKAPSEAFVHQHRLTLESSSSSSSSSAQSSRVASSLPPIQDVVRFTQRTKSFKRSIPSNKDRSVLPLPVKQIVERSESSSSLSSDEEEVERSPLQ